MSSRPAHAACPCGLPQPYPACCGRFHDGQAAPTAELVMRSRYSAYALGEEVYLLDTWHPSTRPATLRLDPAQRWGGLTILGTAGGGLFDANGTVEFEATYRFGKRSDTMHENSRFVREDGRWLYLAPAAPDT